ncbi:hypothetical protein BBI15_13155 [Planococcus plakortidis]|uniref:DUF4440 domain-containing protein n=1 Tax=Planococcus plakortidis TaxID=1038856 RepID=A0A1C7EBJ1_9BACL|nr:DUF4440 domain-containing protein [Planococcus plakortidis]ANU21066.1 hypothetical protein BBI15_13155 [Planococcus plakortidis]
MESLHEQFLALENSHLAPAARESNFRMAEILDDEFWEFGSSGGICRRSDFDSGYALQEDDFRISRFEAKELGPEAVLTMYTLENRTTGAWSHRSSVWKKRSDGWKLFFHQGTKTDGFKKWE